MKVLVISAVYPPTMAPEADHAYHLCDRLAERGVNVDVLTTAGTEAVGNGPVRIHPVMRDWSWRDVPRFLRQVRRCAPDAVLLLYVDWIYNRHPMITFAPSLIKAILPEVTFVTEVEEPTGIELEKCATSTRLVRKAMAAWTGAAGVDHDFGTLLRASDGIIVLSDRHRARLADHYAGVNRKAALIPPPPILRIRPEDGGRSRREGREILGITAEQFLFAYFGYMYPGKGIETLLRAFKEVAASRPAARLAMIGGKIDATFGFGPSYPEEMRALARALGIDEKVRWTGSYPFDSDVASMYLHAADACVFPFDAGVFLNNSSFGAAAAHGLPIIATGDAHGRAAEPQIVDGDNVALCASKSVDALCQGMTTVLDDSPFRDRLRAGASKLAKDWYSWPGAVDRTLAVLFPKLQNLPGDTGAEALRIKRATLA